MLYALLDVDLGKDEVIEKLLHARKLELYRIHN